MFQKNRNQRIGRNDPCPCGSGLKFKKCCLSVQEPATENLKEKYWNQYKIRLKEPKDIEGIRSAGKLVIQTLEMAEEHIQAGMKTEEINTLVHEFTLRHKGIPAPLNYRGFPKSVCVSVNEVICHGIPGDRILKDGDIVNVDVTTILNGYYADASKTFFVGTPSKSASKIVRVAAQSLKRSLEKVKPGCTLGDIGHAIQSYAESQKCSVVREFVGHGVGLDFHEAPQVPHYGKKGQGIECVPGMVFTIEPMINFGKKELKILPDKWTAVTLDNSLSAQFEQTLLVTPEGFESLTPYSL